MSRQKFERIILKVKKKTKIRNLYNQVPHLTRDTIWGSDKNTSKHHTKESQEVSPFQTGDHKAAMNRHGSIIKTNVKHNKLGRPHIPNATYQVPRSPAFWFWRRRFLKGFYHIWAWRPSWSCDQIFCINFG